MLKLFKNLKNSWYIIMIIVILLIGQALLDLQLPSYISDIVNIGIQSGGVEKAVPEVIYIKDMDNLLIFTENDEEILTNYDLIQNENNLSKKNKKDIDRLFEKNQSEVLKNGEIYILKDINNEQENKLEQIIKEPLVMYSMCTNKETSEKMKNEILGTMAKEQKNIMESMSFLEIIKIIPEENQKQIINAANEQIKQMGEMMLDQVSILSVSGIYKSIEVDTNRIQNSYIFITGLKMLGIALLSMTFAIIVLLLASRLAATLGKILREKVFKKVISFSNKELIEFSTASLITRSTNDITQIQQLIVMLFRVVVYAPILGIGGFITVMTQTESNMTWIIGVAIIAIIFVVGTLFIILMPSFKKLQSLVDRLNLVSREILTGLPVIRAFNKEKKEESRFNKANLNLKKVNEKVNIGMSMMMPLLMLIMNVITVVIIWIGAGNVENGTVQVGDLLAFMQYTMQIVMAFLMISIISIMLPRASVSAKRINEILDTKASIKDKEKTIEFNKNKKGLVEFKNVSFKYPDADKEIIEDISFTAVPGETTAIIGSTGSGKSTIINLIPRFYDVTAGTICVDGVDIKDVAQNKLRDKIGFVPQKGILFSGTIESNIKFADENMEDKQMYLASQIAQADEFISLRGKKYKDEIAQGGTNVSGGQKQRLSIARAIASNPDIYIFDDSFSALDFKTDSKLRESLHKITKDKTVIIVAQRINTIINAEKIIVLEEGKIVGIGTHEELLESNETYKQIALSQLSEEELKKKGDI